MKVSVCAARYGSVTAREAPLMGSRPPEAYLTLINGKWATTLIKSR